MVARSQQRLQAQTWKQELASAFTDSADLLRFLEIRPEQVYPAVLEPRRFRVLVPRGFASLMRRGDPDDPLLRQVLPITSEAEPAPPGYSIDPVGDARAQRGPSLLQKYRGRALLITTGACAVHCRYCFRRHYPYAEDSGQRDGYSRALRTLETLADVEEVILSGGDPLLLDDDALANLIDALADQPQIKRLRLHTRLPTMLPSRITETLCEMLSTTRLQAVVVIHANHPAELGTDAGHALGALHRHGLTLLNQSVLLRGVNDNAKVLAALSEALFEHRVLPYYLHLLDPVTGAAHFHVGEHAARALMDELRRRTPGYLVPRLVKERPGAPYKAPLPEASVAPQYRERSVQ
jgi:EF-P beta-lysylation protein EpmB